MPLTARRLDAIATVDKGAAVVLMRAIERRAITSAFLAMANSKWSIIVVGTGLTSDTVYRETLKDRLAVEFGLKTPREQLAIVSQTSDRGEIVRDARFRARGAHADRATALRVR